MATAPEKGAGSQRELVIVLSFETIDDIVERGFARPPDRLILSAARDPSIERVLVVDPYRSLPISLLRRLTAGGTQRQRPDVHLEEIQPYRLRRSDPTSPRALERTYSRYDRSIATAIDRHGFRSPAVISFNPLHAGYGPGGWERSFLYYARDDWTAHPSFRRWWPAFRDARRRIRRRSRDVAAVSKVLLDRVSPTGKGLVLANAVDVSEWSSPGVPPAWFKELPKPRFVYVGTLDDRLDVAMLQEIAAAHPGGSLALVGPCPAGDPTESLDITNVHVIPPQDRRTIVAVTSHADVCLLTHRRTTLTEAMSPLKLYEYLAGGSPVVATDLEPVRGISDRVILVHDATDVLDAVDRALEIGPASEDERLAFVAENSWERRHDELLDFVFAPEH